MSTSCEDWPAETVSRVEARIRATFLAESFTARRVEISCGPSGTASISLEGGPARPVARESPRLEDDVVAAVEVALRELEAPATKPLPEERPLSPAATTSVPPTVGFELVPAPPSTVEPSAAGAPSPAVAPRDTARPASTEGRESRQRVVPELGVSPLVELWSSHWAFGAEAGLSVGDEQLQYGLSLGGAAAAGEPDTFEISEWRGNLRLAWTFPGSTGLRVTAAAGASLLVTTPGADVASRSNAPLGAASFGLHLSRPLWFGSWGAAPTLGARFFSGRRNVRVDAHEELVLPVVSPQAGLWLIYRQE